MPTESTRSARDLEYVRGLLAEIDALPLVERVECWPFLNLFRIRELVERIDGDAATIKRLRSKRIKENA